MGSTHDRRCKGRYARGQVWVVALAILVASCSDTAGPAGSTSQPPRLPVPPPAPTGPAPPPSRPLAPITGRVAFVSTRDGSPWIYVADSAGVRRLAPGDEPAWSPNGTTIAYQSPSGISLMSADGTNDRLIRRGGSQPSWSPDGTQIVFSDGGIRVMQSDGSFDRQLVDNDFIQPGDDMQRPAWSRDGQRIAFVRYDCCWMEPVAIYVVALDGTPPRAVLNGITENGVTGDYSHWSPAWSPDGRSLAFIHNFELAITDIVGRGFASLGIRAAWESDLDWSPDGGQLVFSDYNGQQNSSSPLGHLRLYVAVLATGQVQQLIREAAAAANPDYGDNHAVWSRAP